MNRIPLWMLWCLPLLGLVVVFIVLTRVDDWQREVRLSQEAALAVSAEALASLLTEDERFLAFAEYGTDVANYRSELVEGELVLDGRLSDWPVRESLRLGLDHLLEIHFPYSTDSLLYSLTIGNDEQFLYLHYEVRDDVVVYRKVGGLSVHRNDHIQLAFEDRQGRFHRYTIAVYQPGEVVAVEVSSNGRALREVSAMHGRWIATGQGYNVEIRIPRELISGKMSTLVADVDDETSRELKFLMGLSNTTAPEELGRLYFSPSDFEKALSQLPWGVEVSSVSGRMAITSDFDTNQILATASILSSDPDSAGVKRGTIRLSQTPRPAEHLIGIISDVFDRWIILGLLVLSAFILLVLLLTQTRLKAVKEAIGALADNRGKVLSDREGVEHNRLAFGTDAIGGLFSELKATTDRIGQYNHYLERMASRLNHELRTPISIVKSSLENLRGQNIGPNDQIYVDRASQGVERLTNILNKMAEARRLEESLDENEVIRFNLTEVVSGCVRGYATAYADVEFVLDVEDEDVPITGIPELIAQLLDKLVDNAVGFSSTGEVRIRLHVDNDTALLRVMNEGANLPDNAGLFESMVSIRDNKGESHLGLGLYIARIIAEFHGGTLELANRTDTQGVIVTLALPLLRLTAKLY